MKVGAFHFLCFSLLITVSEFERPPFWAAVHLLWSWSKVSHHFPVFIPRWRARKTANSTSSASNLSARAKATIDSISHFSSAWLIRWLTVTAESPTSSPISSLERPSDSFRLLNKSPICLGGGTGLHHFTLGMFSPPIFKHTRISCTKPGAGYLQGARKASLFVAIDPADHSAGLYSIPSLSMRSSIAFFIYPLMDSPPAAAANFSLS